MQKLSTRSRVAESMAESRAERIAESSWRARLFAEELGRDPVWTNLPKKLKFSCSDGVIVEADKEAMRYASGLVRDLTDAIPGTNGGTIPVPYFASWVKMMVIFCEEYFERFSIPPKVEELGTPLNNCEEVALPPLISRQTPEILKFDEDMSTAWVAKELATYECEKIMRLHEVAKYMDIPFLQETTEALLMRAPSREFLDIVLPGADYNRLEAYRSQHVEACRVY